jgi:hypothetical protein
MAASMFSKYLIILVAVLLVTGSYSMVDTSRNNEIKTLLAGIKVGDSVIQANSGYNVHPCARICQVGCRIVHA